MKVFLDANVFFAAAKSPGGGSGFILELARTSKFEVVAVGQALLEAERNIKNKLGEPYLSRYQDNLLKIKLVVQPLGSISLERIAEFEKFVPLKDVPILLGAILSDVDFLVTLDKRDFLNNGKLKALKFSFRIVNPRDFLRDFLKRV